MGAIDWSRTRAYCLPTDLEGYIRVNLRGRESEGIVAPGADYERACDELTAALLALTDPATGRAAVREVVRTDRAFPGGRRHHLPDLIVIWDAAGLVERLASPAIGTVAMASPDGRPGTHAAPGFLLRVEPAAHGARWEDRDAIAHVRDVAPALYRRFGVTTTPEGVSLSVNDRNGGTA
jgi:predicted AlkP superfamily phosphohydrolase/phosphomutase